MFIITCTHHTDGTGHLVQMHELANSLMLDDWRAEKLFGQPRVKPAAGIGSVCPRIAAHPVDAPVGHCLDGS